MIYRYSEAAKVLDLETPLVLRAQLLTICKEVDADTPEEETTEFIKSAHVVLCNVLDGYGVPGSTLEQIEKYLAAHFAALTYPSVQREGLGPMSRSFAIKAGDGIAATRYGQMAIGLDPTGMLKKFSDGQGVKTVTVLSVGNGILTTPQ